MTRFHFIFYDYIYMCIYIYKHTHMYVFFIHPSIDRCWNFFYVLTIVNNASVNIDILISFQITVLFSLAKYPKWIAGPQSNFVFNFWGNLYTVLDAPIYHPTSSAWGFPFLHILTNTLYLLPFFIIANLTGVR